MKAHINLSLCFQGKLINEYTCIVFNFSSQADPLSCETFLLNESEKFKQIGADKATDIVEQTNKLALKQQLVENERLLTKSVSLTSSKESSRAGVFHQVSEYFKVHESASSR